MAASETKPQETKPVMRPFLAAAQDFRTGADTPRKLVTAYRNAKWAIYRPEMLNRKRYGLHEINREWLQGLKCPGCIVPL